MKFFKSVVLLAMFWKASESVTTAAPVTTVDCGWADGVISRYYWETETRRLTFKSGGISEIGTCQYDGYWNYKYPGIDNHTTSYMLYCNAEETQLMQRKWNSSHVCDGTGYEDEVYFDLTPGAYDCNLDYSCAFSLQYASDNYTDDVCTTYNVSNEDLADWRDWVYYTKQSFALDTCMRTDSASTFSFMNYSAVMYQCNDSTLVTTYYKDVDCDIEKSSYESTDNYCGTSSYTGLAYFRYNVCPETTTTAAPITTDSTTTTTMIPIPTTTTTTTTTPVATIESTDDAANHLVAKSSVLIAVVAMISVLLA